MCCLRQKAISCEFPSVDEAIRDQIIEKCRDPRRRRKFLEKLSEATLTMLQETAIVHVAANTSETIYDNDPEFASDGTL